MSSDWPRLESRKVPGFWFDHELYGPPPKRVRTEADLTTEDLEELNDVEDDVDMTLDQFEIAKSETAAALGRLMRDRVLIFSRPIQSGHM